MSNYRFQVITGVPHLDGDDERAFGNLAACFELWQASPSGMEVAKVNPLVAMNLRAPVFHLGEVLIVDGDGREVVGLGRKASKWDVTYDEFATIDEAIERALEVNA